MNKKLMESYLRTLKSQGIVLVDTTHVTEFVHYCNEQGVNPSGGGLELDVLGFYGFSGQWLYI